ncbi:MAG: hypothetical protein ACNA7T_14805, partial [Haliea sp.]
MASAVESVGQQSALAAESIDPVISRVLGPGEQVYWQGQYTPKRLGTMGSLLMTAAVAAAAWWWFSRTGELQPILAQLQQNPDTRNMVLVMAAVLIIGPLIFNRNPREHYAITSERLLLLRRGKIREQPRPGDIVIVGRRPFRWIHWRYPQTRERSEIRVNRGRSVSGLKCGPDDDPKAVLALLREWQERPTRAAQASSEAYRKRSQAQTEQPAPEQGSAAVGEYSAAVAEEGAVRLVNRELGFTVDLPAPWEVQVEQRFDGPLRVFGITLLPRIIREGKKRPWQAGDSQPWNCLTSRGGPAVGVDFNVQRERVMPTAESVANNNWAKLLGVKVFHVEEDIRIGNFRGFAVVRKIPAGADLTGFGMLPAEVYLRQWWLQGQGL